MKNNRLHFSLFLFASIIAFNITNAQTKIGIKAGVNMSDVMMKAEDGQKENTEFTPGVVLGLTVDIPVTGNFYIQPAAQFSSKGYKQKTGGFYGTATNFKVAVSYIEMPVNILYKPHLGAGNLLVGAGPYIGYGIAGKWKSDADVAIGDIMIGNKGDVIFKNDATEGEFGSYLYGKALDYGVNFLAGYEFSNKLSLQLNAQLGLANLQPEYDGVERKGKLQNKAFGISIGYKF